MKASRILPILLIVALAAPWFFDARGYGIRVLCMIFLFAAVAQVLAYVYRVQQFQKQGGRVPEPPRNLEVPAGLDPLTPSGARNGAAA